MEKRKEQKIELQKCKGGVGQKRTIEKEGKKKEEE